MTPVPTLDGVAADPAQVCDLPRASIEALLHRCVAAQTVLLGALATADRSADDTEPDRLLDVEAAAARLSCSTDWLYRRSKRLPFTVRNGRALRFSSAGIARYIRVRQNKPA